MKLSISEKTNYTLMPVERFQNGNSLSFTGEFVDDQMHCIPCEGTLSESLNFCIGADARGKTIVQIRIDDDLLDIHFSVKDNILTIFGDSHRELVTLSDTLMLVAQKLSQLSYNSDKDRI